MPTNSLDPLSFTSKTWAAKPTTGAGTGSGNVRTPAARREMVSPRENPLTTSRVNPYAAPQVIYPVAKAVTLPVAHFAAAEGARQMYPEYSTEALSALIARRKALDNVQVVWFIITLLLGLLGCYWMITATLQGSSVINAIFYNCLPVLGAAFALIRWSAGFARHRSDRFCALFFDALLFATSWGIVVTHIVNCAQDIQIQVRYISQMLAMPFLAYSGYFSYRSLQVLNLAQPLFGPERLDGSAMNIEFAYRQAHGIE